MVTTLLSTNSFEIYLYYWFVSLFVSFVIDIIVGLSIPMVKDIAVSLFGAIIIMLLKTFTLRF